MPYPRGVLTNLARAVAEYGDSFSWEQFSAQATCHRRTVNDRINTLRDLHFLRYEPMTGSGGKLILTEGGRRALEEYKKQQMRRRLVTLRRQQEKVATEIATLLEQLGE